MFRVQGSGFRVSGLDRLLSVWELACRVQGLGFRV